MNDDDSTGIDVAAVAGLGLSIGKRDDDDNLFAPHKRRYLSRSLSAIPVDGNGWIIWQPAREGKIWHVRRIALMNNDPWTAGVVNSLGAICVGQADSGSVKLTEVRVPGTQIPFIATFGFDELPVKTGEQLYVIVHGGSGKEFATADVQEEDNC